jgi:predicted transport protein
MPLYLNQNNKLKEVEEISFKLEREIQKIFELNLESVMGLTLVKSECQIKNKRIDTLAFDKQSSAFIIIEYKRDRNLSVVDQGFTYLSLMLENKADFIIEYNESLGLNLKRDDVDWSQTRVAFVSTSFTENQILATNFKDIAIELWEVKQFENNIISVNAIKKTSSATSIKPITKQNQALNKVIEEIKVYTEEEHLSKASEEISELYEKFKGAILNLADGIEIKPVKQYIAFKKDRNIVDINVQKNSLKLFINARIGSLNDPFKITRDVSKIGRWGNGDYEVQVDSDKDLEYIMSLVKQVI